MRIPPGVRTAAAVAVLAIAVASVATRTWTNRVVPDDPWQPRYGFCDFRDGFYYSSLAFLSGDDPNDAETYLRKYPVTDRAPLYSPLMYLMYAPFAALPFTAAALAHFVASVVLTVALGSVALRWSGVALTTATVCGLGAFLIFSRPGFVNLYSGQATLVAVLATYVALWHATARPRVSAFALALATFKGTYGLPTAVLLGARGDRRVVALGVLIACLLTAPAVARIAVATGGVAPMVQSVRDSLSTRLTIPRKSPEHSPFRIDSVALAARTLGRAPTTAETLAIMGGILAAAAAAMRRLRPDAGRACRLHATSIGTLAGVAAFYHQSYDGLALVLPLVVLVARPDLEPWRDRSACRWAALVLTAVPFVNFLATRSAGARLGESAVLAASSVNGLAILAALAVHVVLAWRMR